MEVNDGWQHSSPIEKIPPISGGCDSPLNHPFDIIKIGPAKWTAIGRFEAI
ncbi:MAG: hypothetical protein ABEI52_10305 [Halobacteriaceae archaeon]